MLSVWSAESEIKSFPKLNRDMKTSVAIVGGGIMDKMFIGDRIREVRISKGLTQEQLAEKADMSVNFLGEIERNQKLPGLYIFTNIITALDISADYILRDVLPSGKCYVDDEIIKRLEKVSPKHRKIINDLIDAYLKNIL